MNACECGKPERWLPAVGFEGLYEVSDHGRVLSVARRNYGGRNRVRQRFMTLSPDTCGRLQAMLSKDRANHPKFVHHLVLEAFVGMRPANTVACHFPEKDPKNNHLANLRWDTRSANNVDRALHGSYKTKPSQAVLIKQLLSDVRRHPSGRLMSGELLRIAATAKCSYWIVSHIMSGRSWTHLREQS